MDKNKVLSLVLDASDSMKNMHKDAITNVASMVDECLSDMPVSKRELKYLFFGSDIGPVNYASNIKKARDFLPTVWPHNMGMTALHQAVHQAVNSGIEWIKSQSGTQYNYTIIIITDGYNNKNTPSNYEQQLDTFKELGGNLIIVGPGGTDTELNNSVCKGRAMYSQSYNPATHLCSDGINYDCTVAAAGLSQMYH